jgi:pimeloyl-ACP methyl ester carboxylesterase
MQWPCARTHLASYGWSDPSPHPRTSEYEVNELHTLLERAEIPGPYLMVAHSLGGYTTRLFATRHRQEVAGLVLIDTTHEDTWTHPEIRAANQQFGVFASICRATTPIGLFRVLGHIGLLAHPFPALLPPEQQAAATALTLRPHYCPTIDEETDLENIQESAVQLRVTRRPLDLPVLVLTADAGYPDDAYRAHWLADQADLLRLSSQSEQRLIADATHISILTEHTDAVVEAVRDTLARIHSRKS